MTATYGYMPSGQVATRARSNDAYAWTNHYNVDRAYMANGRNQYTLSGPVVPTYDARGNLTSAGATSYAYDGDNLLTSASGGEGSATLAYDPTGRLYQTAGTATTRFGYDGQALISPSGIIGALLTKKSACVGIFCCQNCYVKDTNSVCYLVCKRRIDATLVL